MKTPGKTGISAVGRVKRRYTLPIMAGTLLFFGILLVSSVLLNRYESERIVQKTMTLVMDSTVLSINEYVDERFQDLIILADSENTQRILTELTAAGTPSGTLPDIRDTLIPFRRGRPGDPRAIFLPGFVFSPDGELLATAIPEDIREFVVRSVPLRPPADVLQGQDDRILFTSVRDSVQSYRFLLDLYTPVFYSGSREVLAVLVMRIDIPLILSIFTVQGRFDLTGETYLIDREGRALTPVRNPETPGIMIGRRVAKPVSGKNPYEYPLTDTVALLVTRQPSEPVFAPEPYINHYGKTVLGGGLWLDELNMGIVAEVRFREVIQPFIRDVLMLSAVILFSTIAFLIFALMIDRLRLKALDSNPLTLLPGNRCVAEAVTKALRDSVPRTVVYCDLDNFKAFNDKYGFSEGDNVIHFTGDVLTRVFRKMKPRDSFIGHIGGDDFVYITDTERVEEIAEEVGTTFDREIRSFYSEEDLRNGYIEAKDRQGEFRRFPVMALSMSGVGLSRRVFSHHLEVSAVCAELKKKAKAIPGSVLFLDRRREDDSE